MHRFLITFFALLALATQLPAAATPPNVLFIAVDDLRPELHCYGATHMVTPNIDRLADQGRLFRRHYVSVPTCGASRYALLSGLRPTSATDDNDAFKYMPKSYPSKPESWVDLLRRNGWRTVSLAKITHEPDGYRWHYPSTYDHDRQYATFPEMRFSWNEILFDHNKWGAQRYPLFSYADGTGRVKHVTPASEIGVDSHGASIPDDGYPDGLIAQAAIEKLREFKDDGTRFCLAVGFFKPHLPFNAPKKYYDLYDPDTLPGPDPAAKPIGANPKIIHQSGEIGVYADRSDRAKLRRAYFACVSYTDAQVGKVLDELDALGMADNTVVILWGDHGWCLDDYTLMGKHVVLERGVQSPLIIRPPASMRPEVFAGVPAEGIVETVDIYPTIAELCGLAVPSGPVGSSLAPMLRNPFAPGKEYAYSRFMNMTAVRTQKWRLIQESGTKDLYDLAATRYERENVSSSHPDVVSELSAKLTVQATRPGTTYSVWAGGNPLLADPEGDADSDGIPNQLEYGAGTDALDPASRPAPAITFEDLTAMGLGNHETIYSFTIATDPDDIVIHPSTSTNLIDWSFDPLEFLDATDFGNHACRLRFRLTSDDPSRFFQFGLYYE